MSIIKVNKINNFTVMSNHHFRNKLMSLKAKGLLSMMLSLPEDWDYTVEGLCTLSSDGRVATMTALKELEEFGYLTRKRIYINGKVADVEYNIYEIPIKEDDDLKTGNLMLENLTLENLTLENHEQLNTNKINNLNNKNTNNKKNTKKDSKSKYLENCEKIISEYDFSEEVISRIFEYLQTRAKLRDNQLRIQLEILAKLTDKEQLESLKVAIGAGWNMMCYPKNNKQKYTKPKSDIQLTEQEEKQMAESNKQFRQDIQNAGGIQNYREQNNLQKF